VTGFIPSARETRIIPPDNYTGSGEAGKKESAHFCGNDGGWA
jgi:hypothetical protein